MKYITFSEEQDKYPVVLLTKESTLSSVVLEPTYKKLFDATVFGWKDLLAIGLPYDKGKTVSAKQVKDFIFDELLETLDSLGTRFLIINDASYFKYLTNQKKPNTCFGFVYPCVHNENIQCVYVPATGSIVYDPSLEDKVHIGLQALQSEYAGIGSYKGFDPTGTKILRTYEEIVEGLRQIKDYPVLNCDIEAFSLKFHEAGIGTIGFSWGLDVSQGFVIVCDYSTGMMGVDGLYGEFIINPTVRTALAEFFIYRASKKSEGYKLRFHNASYDVKVLIYTLYMNQLIDWYGLNYGVQLFQGMVDDTKVISYLALNSCTRISLSLKDLAQAFTGNYAQDSEDIKDIRRIPLQKLCEYNLTDCMATHYVYDQMYSKMIQDDQLDVYQTIFMPSVELFWQVELVGMPISMVRVQEVKRELMEIQANAYNALRNNPRVKAFEDRLRQLTMEKTNAKLKTKQHSIEHFASVSFNPNSNPQLQDFLYEFLHFPILDRTKSGNPAIDKDTLKGLKARTKNPEVLEVLNALLDLSEVNIILNNFIESFENNSILKEDHNWYLHGGFNVGGTVSGRLSSSSPNMQNIPSGGRFGKLIKSCFVSTKDWLFCGADFASLEDRISALTTKDINKVRVYSDGYDGHCLRAYSYFTERMPDIDPNSVESINSIADKYPQERQDSKAPTFALTYRGTYLTLMKNCGFSEELAKQIESRYHELYVESDQWVDSKIQQATINGYITAAFGLRVRTPLLAQVVYGSESMPSEAAKEARTAGNALGQSYCMLNNRAGIELQKRTLASEFSTSILPVAHIHDAQYFLVRNTLPAVHWLNKNLGECMAWQELSEIQHDQVKLSGELDIFYPNWSKSLTLPNNASEEQISELVTNYLKPKDPK